VKQLYQVKRMIRGLGTVLCLDLFSNFKWVRSRDYLSESLGLMHSPSGPFLVSRTGDEG
jgi:hypothetical protein